MVSDDDKALFRNTMQSVKPLGPVKTIPSNPEKPSPVRRPRIPEPPPTITYPLSHQYTETVGPETLLAYGQGNLPKKRWGELKSGQIPWQGRLDLHGMTPDTASQALTAFLEHHQAEDHRCVLIIHGKGGRHHEVPLLKNHVAHWLKQLPHTQAFHSALPRHGGAGALYVLLRRAFKGS